MIGNRECALYVMEGAKILLIQLCDQEEIEDEIGMIRENTAVPFTMAAVAIHNWNQELSPWEAEPVFGKDGFGDGAAETLQYITEELIPYMFGTQPYEKIILGGYSLAGLFALWAGYQTDVFSGIAAVSPSVWFDHWDTYRETHVFQAEKVYLSLGTKEEKARNQTMAKVGDRIRSQAALMEAQGIDCVLEWNPGNHFRDPGLRMAKGFSYLLQKL